MKRAAIVLCGGRSRRMGRPKALLPWFGRTLLEHVLAILEGCVDERIVVTSAALSLPPARLRARVVVDREPERGPLAALRDGLAATTAERVFVTACDAPLLSPGYVEALFARAQAGGGAAVPVAEGFVQVLSAVYPQGAGAQAAALLEAGGSSPLALLERIGFSAIEPASLATVLGRAPADLPPWTGCNTPEAYLALARRIDPAATARVEWRPARGIEAAADGVGAARGRDASQQRVPIGGLMDVLERAAPRSASAEGASARSASGSTAGSAFERFARGELQVELAEGMLGPAASPDWPIGPGELVRVREVPSGEER